MAPVLLGGSVSFLSSVWIHLDEFLLSILFRAHMGICAP